MSLLFKNADILVTETDGFSVIRNGFLGVKGNKIAYIGSECPNEDYDEIRDFNHKMLIPGLINTHCHIPMTLLRGRGSDRPLQSWLFDYMVPIEDKFTGDDISAGAYLGLLEMLSTGTTSFTDMYFHADRIADACLEAGIKANLCAPIQSFNPADEYDKMTRPVECMELYKQYHGAGDGRIRIDYSIHAEYTCNKTIARRHSNVCKELGLRMHIHLSETKSEHETCVSNYGQTPAQWFDELGVFENPTCAAHCVWVTDEDIMLLAEKGVSVMHNPTSNMKLGSGFAPVERMRVAGVNVALGTDGAGSNNNLNMFEEMHLASIIHNGARLDPTIMKAANVFRMATLNGAILQGRGNTGMLKEGYDADILAIDMDQPHLFPNPDPVSTLCYSAQGSDVCMNMVDGKILYENGEYLTLDKDKILYEARKTYDRLTA